MGIRTPMRHAVTATLLAVTASLAPVAAVQPVQAQTADARTAARVDRLERELRAVQRKVFPGSDSGYFEPEIQPETAAPGPAATSSPVADLIARIDAIEASLAQITDQVEGMGNRQRLLADELAAYKAATDKRIADLAAAGAAPPASDAGADTVEDRGTDTGDTPAATPRATPRSGSGAPRGGTASTPSGAANADRIARVRAIPVPASGDGGEDAYLYGYRLWEAKLYPEAQAQLEKAVREHPRHRRASFAQNLLGRAYLDDNKPALAAKAFIANYQDRPDGERAPDSLYYLGVALTRLDQKPNACKAFKELEDVYGARLSATLRADLTRARADAACR